MEGSIRTDSARREMMETKKPIYDPILNVWMIDPQDSGMGALPAPDKAIHGGAGSGNFGHEGRPGERGGSAPGGGGGGTQRDLDPKADHSAQAEVVSMKYARVAAGSGQEIKGYDSKDEVETILSNTKYAIISAGRNSALEPEGDYAPRHEQLKADLISKGYRFAEVEGKYGTKEPSFLLLAHDPDTKEFLDLGSKFNQDSVIVGESGTAYMIKTTGPEKGSFQVAKDYRNVDAKESDFYTKVPLKDGSYTRFSLNFDSRRPTNPVRRRKYIQYLLRERELGDSMDLKGATVTFHGNFCEQVIHNDLFQYAAEVCTKRMLKDGLGTKVEGKEFPQIPEEEFQDRMVALLRYAETRFDPLYEAEPKPLVAERMKALLTEAIDTILED